MDFISLMHLFLIYELEKEQPTSQQGLKNQQDLLGEINTTIKPSQANNVI